MLVLVCVDLVSTSVWFVRVCVWLVFSARCIKRLRRDVCQVCDVSDVHPNVVENEKERRHAYSLCRRQVTALHTTQHIPHRDIFLDSKLSFLYNDVVFFHQKT